MKKIILLRHAKSSWKHPGLTDHDRPLNKRGRTAAQLVGTWLSQNDHVPDVILSSTSQRTRETLDRLGRPAQSATTIEYLPELYHAAPAEILRALRQLDETHRTAMIVGHEPGISAFAEILTRNAEPARVEAFDHFPTAAVAIFQVEITR